MKGTSSDLQIKGSNSILNPLILFQTLCCGYSFESSQRVNSNEYPQHRVLSTVLDSISVFQNFVTPSSLELWLMQVIPVFTSERGFYNTPLTMDSPFLSRMMKIAGIKR